MFDSPLNSSRSRRWRRPAPPLTHWPNWPKSGVECGRRPKRTVEELAKLDAQFHERLASLIKNETLLQQLKAIDERLFVFRMIDFEAADRVKNTCAQHLAILDRIAARDAEGAREAMRRNVTDGRNIVGKSIKEALARAYDQ